MIHDRLEESPIQAVEAAAIDAFTVERVARDVFRHDAVARHLRVVADAAQQAIHDARRPPRAPGHLHGAAGLDARF